MEPAEPKKDRVLGFLIITTLGTIFAIFLIQGPAITHPSFIFSILNKQAVEVILIPGLLLILVFGTISIVVWKQCLIDANPLSAEEKNDPLTREIMVTGSLDHAYDLCHRALYAVPSSRWYTIPDRKNNALVAWPLWGKNAAKINFSFSQRETDRIRVVVSAATNFRWYSDKPGGDNAQMRDFCPEKAYASDQSRRVAIYSLNKIQHYFDTVRP